MEIRLKSAVFIRAQVYLYKLTAVAANLHGVGHFILFRLQCIPYHGMKNLDVEKKKVHMSVQHVSLIILQAGIAITVMSSRHYRETTNGHKQYKRFISHVKDITMFQQFVLGVFPHRRSYVSVKALWTKHWGPVPWWRLHRGEKLNVSTTRTSMCGGAFVIRGHPTFCLWSQHGRSQPSGHLMRKWADRRTSISPNESSINMDFRRSTGVYIPNSIGRGASWASVVQRGRSRTPALLLGPWVPHVLVWNK